MKKTLKEWLTKILDEKNRKQTMMFVIPVAIGILFLGGKIMVSDIGDLNIPSAKVKKGDVTIKITEIGELRAQKQVTISAINDKQITWLVPEGLWVEEGDTLLKMESGKYLISRGEAESSVLVAKAELSKARSELEAQQAKEEAAKKNYESLPELAEKGFVMESEVEQARLTYVELKSKSKSYQAGIDAARANVQRAERAYAQQDRKLREGVVVAPRAGLVVYALVGSGVNMKKIEVGMTPFEGMDLMYLPDVSSMIVQTEINEVDLSRVKKGMPAEIRLDAYPKDVFKGEVAKIADLARRKISRVTGRMTGAKVFDVTVKVSDKDLRLKPGLTATSDIIVKEYRDALYVPLETIFLDEQEQTFVYLKKKRKITEQRVTVADSNDRVAVITEGLTENDEVLLSRPL